MINPSSRVYIKAGWSEQTNPKREPERHMRKRPTGERSYQFGRDCGPSRRRLERAGQKDRSVSPARSRHLPVHGNRRSGKNMIHVHNRVSPEFREFKNRRASHTEDPAWHVSNSHRRCSHVSGRTHLNRIALRPPRRPEPHSVLRATAVPSSAGDYVNEQKNADRCGPPGRNTGCGRSG